jgi:pimeloyl-ACP methyl ester carboxylesterase
MKIYVVSGLGANELIFSKLVLPSNYELIHLPWLMPTENETIESYAQRMSNRIDVNEKFILMGLSLGGIIAQEIAKIKPPRKLILFSTIKSENEKPLWISMNQYLHINKIFPYFLLNNYYLVKIFANLIRLIKPNAPDLSRIYTFRDNRYTKWAFQHVIDWKNIPLEIETHHFHGTSDFVFPYSKIQDPIKLENGTHVCVYEQAEKISEILNEILP